MPNVCHDEPAVCHGNSNVKVNAKSSTTDVLGCDTSVTEWVEDGWPAKVDTPDYLAVPLSNGTMYADMFEEVSLVLSNCHGGANSDHTELPLDSSCEESTDVSKGCTPHNLSVGGHETKDCPTVGNAADKVECTEVRTVENLYGECEKEVSVVP